MDLSNDQIAPIVQDLMAEIFRAGIKLEGGGQYNKVFGILYKQSQRISELEAENEKLIMLTRKLLNK